MFKVFQKSNVVIPRYPYQSGTPSLVVLSPSQTSNEHKQQLQLLYPSSCLHLPITRFRHAMGVAPHSRKRNKRQDEDLEAFLERDDNGESDASFCLGSSDGEVESDDQNVASRVNHYRKSSRNVNLSLESTDLLSQCATSPRMMSQEARLVTTALQKVSLTRLTVLLQHQS